MAKINFQKGPTSGFCGKYGCLSREPELGGDLGAKRVVQGGGAGGSQWGCKRKILVQRHWFKDGAGWRQVWKHHLPERWPDACKKPIMSGMDQETFRGFSTERSSGYKICNKQGENPWSEFCWRDSWKCWHDTCPILLRSAWPLISPKFSCVSKPDKTPFLRNRQAC